MEKQPYDPQEMLPLSPITLHLLVSLLEGHIHGYAMMKATKDRTKGKMRLGPTTLYRTIRRMVDSGLICDLDEQAAHEPDEKRRYYKMTEFGHDVFNAEVQRLIEMLGYLAAAKESSL
jgi:DNA-binding PadR family transcriptional regulator